MQPTLHPYARISDPTQRKGGGLERQTQADVTDFARTFGFAVSKRVLVDDGVSAWKGLNATPKHQLGQFLAEARRGLIPPGDCLLLENYDRLSRQNPWAAIGLVNDLRELGIHIGRLDRMKLLRCDSEDPGDFFEAAIELMRGNSESNAKSSRNRAKWIKRRQATRESGAVLTNRLPGWVEAHDGGLRLIADRALVLRRIYDLAERGYGAAGIVGLLTREKVPAWGPSGHWTRAYVALLLTDRRVLGEFQPRLADGTPDGELLLDYFPRVLASSEFDRVQGARQGRQQPRGHPGKRVELFSGLLKNARDGGSYYVATRNEDGKLHRVLLNTHAAEGRARCYSFPLSTFETAVLSLLAELDAQEILNGDAPDESLALGAELAGVEARIAELEAELNKGDVAALARVLRQLEERQRDLTARLARARQQAAHPLSESWGQAQSLLEALQTAPDPVDVRTRLRAALHRILEAAYLLVVPRGRSRLCAVQVHFRESDKRRDYLILHRPARANAKARQEGGWWARSLSTVAKPGDLDLRKPDHVKRLEAVLVELDLTGLDAEG